MTIPVPYVMNQNVADSTNAILSSTLPTTNTVHIHGELMMNGENIDDRLKRIEKMLHIPSRNIIMEGKYDKLNKLWKEYIATLESHTTWENIKESS